MNTRHSSTALRRAVTVGRYVLVAVIGALMVLPLLVSSVNGSQFLTVDGGSMQPTYSRGDLILVTPAGPGSVRPGTIVTARRPDGILYTHRVISVTATGEVTTQGDANPIPDTKILSSDDVVGAVTAHIPVPYATLLSASQSLPGRISLAAIIAGLILFPTPARLRRRRTKPPLPEASTNAGTSRNTLPQHR